MICVYLLVVELKIRQLCWSVQFVCLFVRPSVCLSVRNSQATVLIASPQYYTSLFLGATRRNRLTIRRSRSKVKVRKNLGKLEKSLSLTWAEISKIHNFGKSNDNRFKFDTRVPMGNIYRCYKVGLDRIQIPEVMTSYI